MVEVTRLPAEHFYVVDVVLDHADAHPAEIMREMNMGPASDDRPPPRKPRRRRARPASAARSHGALSPDMRVLYRHFLESGMPLSRYAADWIGVSRQTVWSWFQGLSYPYPSMRAQIKARTGIEIGPEPPDVTAHRRRTDETVSRSQRLSSTSGANTEAARSNNRQIRASIAHHRTINGRKGEP